MTNVINVKRWQTVKPDEPGFYLIRFGHSCDESTIEAAWVDYAHKELCVISIEDCEPVRLLDNRRWLKIEMSELAKIPTQRS